MNVVDKVEETSKDGGAGWMIGGNVEFCRRNLTDVLTTVKTHEDNITNVDNIYD